MFDGKAFGKEMVEIVKAHVAKTVAPLLSQIDALKVEIDALKAMPATKDGLDGKSITVDDVAPMIIGEIEKASGEVRASIPEAVQAAVAALPAAKDGKDADPAVVQSLVKEIVEQAVAALPVAKDGQSVTVDDVRPIIEAEVSKAAAAIPVPKDGQSITLDDVRPLIEEAVTKAVTLIPAPKDGAAGASVTLDDVTPMIKAEIERISAELPDIGEMVREAVFKIPEGLDGKDADPELIKQMVTNAVAALPPAKNGKDGATAEELLPIINETVSKAVSAIPVPKDGRDGVDVKDLLVVEGGELVATFTDGRTKILGQFRGKDGDAGAAGKDGTDGLGFEDMTEELADDGRTIIRRYMRGDQTREFRHTMSVVLDRGVYQEAKTYQTGDGVSWGGQFYIAQCETTAKPQTPEAKDDWRLSIKKGRDGKDGIVRTVNEKPIVKVGG